MFYLSERDVIHALVNARARGAEVRVLLDPNKDAFGRTKNGIPNRPVAVELRRGGVSIRWCDTRGEQAHSKMLLCRFGDGDCVMILGSANLTRRNICDFNLETDAMIEASIRSEGVRLASEHFEALWNNHGGRTLSLDFAEYAEPSAFKAVAYRIAEFTGMCTF
jgi:phosphatidylserine/phosphatidylglycerophosphate/cardiolipin synthase-like enzyme